MNKLEISKPSVYSMAKSGQLTSVKTGPRSVRFCKFEVEVLSGERSCVYAWPVREPTKQKCIETHQTRSVRADYKLFYIQEFSCNSFKAVVQGRGFGEWQWIYPSSNAEGMKSLIELSKGAGFMFLGTDIPWMVTDVRIESFSGGRDYVVVYLEKDNPKIKEVIVNLKIEEEGVKFTINPESENLVKEINKKTGAHRINSFFVSYEDKNNFESLISNICVTVPACFGISEEKNLRCRIIDQFGKTVFLGT